MSTFDETDNQLSRESRSILDGIYQTVDNGLQLNEIGEAPHCQHRTSWKRVRESDFSSVTWRSLVRSLAERIESNWDQQRCRGKENWRNEPQLELSDHNSGEKKLEKQVAKFCAGWVNQVPTCSGINEGSRDGKRSVDLAHLHGDTLELIELKIDSAHSDTPLWAAFEILIYGLLYRFSRAHRDQLGYTRASNPLLFDCSAVDLKVLAPLGYYLAEDRAAIQHLESVINASLSALHMDGYSMTLTFESFTTAGPDADFGRAACEAIISGRVPVVGP